MAQFKIYGHEAFLGEHAVAISGAIHRASVEALGLPEEKNCIACCRSIRVFSHPPVVQ